MSERVSKKKCVKVVSGLVIVGSLSSKRKKINNGQRIL